MEKLHLNFSELSEQAQAELKQKLFDHWLINSAFKKSIVCSEIREQTTREEIDKLFNLNNAGIDIDGYQWLIN